MMTMVMMMTMTMMATATMMMTMAPHRRGERACAAVAPEVRGSEGRDSANLRQVHEEA